MGGIIPLPKAKEQTPLPDVVLADCCGGSREAPLVRIAGEWHLAILTARRVDDKRTEHRVASVRGISFCPHCGVALSDGAPVRRFHHNDDTLGRHVSSLAARWAADAGQPAGPAAASSDREPGSS